MKVLLLGNARDLRLKPYSDYHSLQILFVSDVGLHSHAHLSILFASNYANRPLSKIGLGKKCYHALIILKWVTNCAVVIIAC